MALMLTFGEEDGVFSKLLAKMLEWLLICVFGMMVILVFGNMVLRYGFNYEIIFSEEVSRFLFVWMVFLGAVLMLRDNEHLGVHNVTKLLPLAGKLKQTSRRSESALTTSTNRSETGVLTHDRYRFPSIPTRCLHAWC